MSLSVMLLMAMGMAINLYFRMLEVRRTNVEEAQIARAAMKLIADDLRTQVAPFKLDLSGLEAVVQNAATAAANSAAGGGGAAMLAGGGGGGGGGFGGGGGGGGGGNGGRGGQGGDGAGRGGQGGDDGGGRGGQGGNDGGRGGDGNNNGDRGGPPGGGGDNNQTRGGNQQGNQSGPQGGNQGGPTTSGSKGQKGGGGGGGFAGGGGQGGGGQNGGGQQGRGGQQGGNRGGGFGGGMVGGGGMVVPTGQSGQSGQQAGASGTSTDPNAAATTAETAEPTNVVNLYGTSSELRLDISRLPRAEQYQGMMEADASGELSPTDLPSDIKTVIYFLLSDESADAAASTLNVSSGSVVPSATNRGRGLMRTELDRAVTLWSEANGQLDSAYEGGKLLAPEIVGLWFRYHDGSSWSEEWDSKTAGGLPRAVEITMTLKPTYAMNDAGLAAQAAQATQISPTGETTSPLEQEFRLVVNLPSAPLVPDTTAATTDPSDPAAAGATSSTGATGSSAAGGTSAGGLQ